ncbi:hypothetical protein BYT27DRAFT_7128066 [Phlegmacium glaucopus]|nr:hypothetical protein BYT27DRAFT_7128066 [Phlegmacium glaucopus]
MDDEPRPSKRQRTSSLSGPTIELTPLPRSALLLSLPSLLLHPPNHQHHTRSLWLSLFALRKCLTLPTLEPYEECRALTEVAEIGFKIGLADSGIESEVEKSITKALLLTQKHPSLRIYKPQITRLSARLSSYQHNPRFAQTTLKRILTSFLVPSDPPHIVYSSHLAYITSLSSSSSPTDDLPQSSNYRAFGAIRDLHELATKNGHGDTVGVLALVLELRDLVLNGLWHDVGILLQKVEGALTLKFVSDSEPTSSETTVVSPRVVCNLEKVFVIHVLIIGIIFHTYVGDQTHTRMRLRTLHDMLDGGALDAFGPSGIVEIPFENPPSPSLFIQVTHPRIIFAMGFLVSSVAKRDPVGRKPKRKMFAAEGLAVLQREAKKEVEVPPWASVSDVREFEGRMSRIRADLICELIGVSICRSEFDEAEHHLAILIAHTRTHNIFSSYCARITLHQAHLAHALGKDDRAEKCYKVAAFLSRKRMMGETKKLGVNNKRAPTDEKDEDEGCEDHWVNVSARVGEIWLRIGVLSRTASSSLETFGKGSARMDHEKENDESESEKRWQREMNELRISSEEVIAECEGLGGTLQAIGAVLSACLSKAFLQAKSNLRAALQLSTSAQDNHLRALILSLIASQYVHTSTEHAETMLTTAEQLAAGLGASVVKGGGGPKISEKQVIGQGTGVSGSGGSGEKLKLGDGVGNAHLRLWIGERSLELKRRAGNGKGASRQVTINEQLREAVVRIKKRKLSEVD